MTTGPTSDRPDPSPAAKRAFRDCVFRIHCPSSAERLWNRCFSDQDRQQLGNDLNAAYRAHRTAGMWATLKGSSLDRAVVDVGYLLNFLTESDFKWLLQEIGEYCDAEEAMTAAIAAGHLVLVERPRSAYWDGQAIAIDWNRENASWEFLWELSRSAKAGHSIDRYSFGESTAMDIVAKRKYRLVNMPGFPVALTDHIVHAGRGTQSLRYPPERTRIFERSGSGSLVEWYP